MNRTYSNKAFEQKNSAKLRKEKTPYLKRTVSGSKKIYVKKIKIN